MNWLLKMKIYRKTFENVLKIPDIHCLKFLIHSFASEGSAKRAHYKYINLNCQYFVPTFSWKFEKICKCFEKMLQNFHLKLEQNITLRSKFVILRWFFCKIFDTFLASGGLPPPYCASVSSAVGKTLKATSSKSLITQSNALGAEASE